MTDLLVHVVKILVVFHVVLIVVAYMTLAERKVSAWMQERVGPNRVGFRGLLQPIADGLKFIFKEEMVPGHVDKLIYTLAPVFVMAPAFLGMAVIPFGRELHLPFLDAPVPMVIADLDVGILFVLAISSLSVYGIVLGGWASNSKYSMMGGIRSSAQMISYEVCMGLSLIGLFMLDESLSLMEVVRLQAEGDGWWHIFNQPVPFVIFLIAGFAETNRLPFDMPEAETELVAGYHTEYSSMKFAMFFMGEYAAMVVFSMLITALFLGGYDIPFVDWAAHDSLGWDLLAILSFAAKVAAFLFLFLWIRWTLPRFRFDQLMDLGWKIFLPATLGWILITGAWVTVIEPWWSAS